MKLSLTQDNLSRALAAVGRVVSTRSSLPVLSNVLLTAETNLEIGINYWIGCKVEDGGALTVPARLFNEFVSSLPSGTIELSATDTNLSIKTPHYASKINGISAEEFPAIPSITSNPVLTLPASQLKDAFVQVVVAASLDEARPVLAGVYLSVDDDTLIVAGTDSYRLAEKRLKLAKAGKEDLTVIVPVRTIQELIRLLGDTEGEVEIYLDENQIMFRLDNIELVSRLIEGTFPNYQQIIPESSETSFEIDTTEFSRITKVASLFARENAGSVRIEVRAEGQVNIVSSDSEVGGNTSSAECEVSGEDGEISLNARYLSDALSVIKSPRVTFAISGKLNPCILTPAGKDASDDYLHIVMPLRT
jgi:DNA polymerase-3 subunit beta